MQNVPAAEQMCQQKRANVLAAVCKYTNSRANILAAAEGKCASSIENVLAAAEQIYQQQQESKCASSRVGILPGIEGLESRSKIC